MEYDESTKFYTDKDENQDLWLLLTHTRYAVFRAREKELQRYGVSPEQVGLLFVVQALGNKATPATISRHIMRQPHTVSALVDRMAKRGLVKKTKDLDRKNLVRVVLTEKGKKTYELSTKRGPIHRIMSVLDKEEKSEFKVSLSKLLAKARKEIGMDREELIDTEL
ncbi:MAG TPA: MarR family transcriptional regulator [Dehalococcoidales bacterium]|nr:MarR family transcriptional regulator [Dehalococcoidales bacterium]